MVQGGFCFPLAGEICLLLVEFIVEVASYVLLLCSLCSTGLQHAVMPWHRSSCERPPRAPSAREW
jgi:hypothetical protein